MGALVDGVHERVLAHREVGHEEERLLEHEAHAPRRSAAFSSGERDSGCPSSDTHPLRRRAQPRKEGRAGSTSPSPTARRAPRTPREGRPSRARRSRARAAAHRRRRGRARAPTVPAAGPSRPASVPERSRGHVVPPQGIAIAHAFLRWRIATGSTRESRHQSTAALAAAAASGSAAASAIG